MGPSNHCGEGEPERVPCREQDQRKSRSLEGRTDL